MQTLARVYGTDPARIVKQPSKDTLTIPQYEAGGTVGQPASIEQAMRVLADALTASDDLSRALSASILKALTQDPSRIDELASKLAAVLAPPKKRASPETGAKHAA